MPSIINASTSTGLIQTADTSGVLELQSGGTTIASVSSTGVAVTGLITATGSITATGQIAALRAGTAVASTSGTSIDFTSIPSWVERITIMFGGVSTSGTSEHLIQVGTSGGVVTTGYLSTSGRLGSGGTANQSFTTGFAAVYPVVASYNYTGQIVLSNITGNTWVESGSLVPSNTAGQITISGGSIALGATLDRVRITTVNGTDTFDAGTINILYE